MVRIELFRGRVGRLGHASKTFAQVKDAGNRADDAGMTPGPDLRPRDCRWGAGVTVESTFGIPVLLLLQFLFQRP